GETSRHDDGVGSKGVTVAVNSGMAHLSDGLFTTAIATYTLAMATYTAEYAFGRRGRVAATSQVAAPAKVLVGAGGPPVGDRPTGCRGATCTSSRPWWA